MNAGLLVAYIALWLAFEYFVCGGEPNQPKFTIPY